ncbi:MAG: prolipoprotein diacylglyceryl transferase [Firmicutes bacterium]|nr:prolipoprotein diacylglyceryl transferase [Bacillota bacterium]
MSQVAIYSGGTVIYWSAVIICIGVAAWFALSYSLYTANGGRGAALWLLLPVATLMSVLFCRAIHWYCHPEQYAGFFRALTDYSYGGYCLPGMLLGVLLSALLVKRLRFADSAAGLLDALAPGAALGIALFRLSALFNTSCRSTIIIKSAALQHLPIGSGVPTSSGGVEYRFATFFVQFLLMLLLTALLLRFYQRQKEIPMKRGGRQGHTAMMFIVFYSAMELVLDSTRYDSSFLRLNGFVSLVQIVSALSILAVLVYYSIQSVRANGRCFYHWLLWLAFAAGVGGTGAFEYLVQRHGNWYKMCYSVMSLCCLVMALTVYFMYRSLRRSRGD